jgi:hypothetical protein
LLQAYKLGFYQSVQENSIVTVVFHTETGEKIESKINLIEGVELKGMNAFQVLGSQITYLRRYALSALLGIVTDEDTDAAGEQVKNEKVQNLPWLNRLSKDGKELESYRKIVDTAKERGLTAEDLLKYYKINREVFKQLKTELS